ncbi:MAG TPA: glycosyltransferase family 39 protein, partial [bacterium]|nr:glycosyltransferase family 39 protein [bacterium]
MTGPLARAPDRTAAAVFLAALAIRSIFLISGSDAPTFDVPIVDAATYRIRALRLAGGDGVTPAFFWQPVFYPLFLAAVHSVLGPAAWTAKIVQAVVGAGSCALTCRLGTIAFDRRTGLAAGLVTAAYGPLVFFDGELLATGWATFWSVALLVLLVRASVRLRIRDGLLLGACAGLGVLTRPTLLPFVAAAAVWLAMRGAGPRG